MSRGLYTAASGMLVGMERQLSLANMLANINTPGFKAEQVITRSFPSVLARATNSSGTAKLGSGVIMERVGVDLTPGAYTRTGSDLDVALDGAGFFVVRDAEDNLHLTRDGHFVANPDGLLVTMDGSFVLTRDDTTINVSGGDVSFQSDGTVLVGGEVAGTLRLATAPVGTMLRAGSAGFVVRDETTLEEATPFVRQGTLEASNVNATQVMTEMVTVARAYESSQRIFSMQNQILSQTVRDVGRI